MCLKNNFFQGLNKKIKKSYFIPLFIMLNFNSSEVFAASSLNSQNSEVYQNSAQVEVKLSLLSNKKAGVIIRIPTQQAYGFTGNAETPEQKVAVDSVVDKVKQNINNIIAVEPSLECKYEINDIDKFTKAKEKYEKTSKVDKKKVNAEYNVLEIDVTLNCMKDLPNQTLNINLSQNFKNINKILVDLKSKQKRKFAIDSSSGSFSF